MLGRMASRDAAAAEKATQAALQNSRATAATSRANAGELLGRIEALDASEVPVLKVT